MKAFPFLTGYVNETFENEKHRLDYIFLRPVLQVSYFFLRIVLFPLKFLIHRGPYGFEARCIDGDYNLDSLSEMVRNNLTTGHDALSYELVDRFDRDAFLADLDRIRRRVPDDHMLFSKRAMESTRKHSLQWIGITNVVITVFGDLRTTVKALNSFGSDAVLLWAMKHLYAHDHAVLTDFGYYLQAESNRGHYNSNVFFSSPSLYLHNHIAFDEYAYQTPSLPVPDPANDATREKQIPSRNPSFLLLVVYFTLPAMAAWVVRDWMPDILRERFNLGQGKAGVSAVIYWQLAAIVGAVLGGWLADRWMRTNIRGRIFVSAIGTFLLLPALFGVGNASTLLVAVLFLIVFGIGWGFFDCNSMPILCQLVGPEHRATGYGLMNFVSISCGGFADWIFGVLRDRHMPLNLIFGVFAGIALLSIFIALCIRPRESTTS